MKVSCDWNGGLQFSGAIGDHRVLMDAKPPQGNYTAPTPKEVLLMSICACSGMDIVAILKKHKQDLESFAMFTEPTVKEGAQPAVYSKLQITYELEGENVDPKLAVEAVHLSMTKYCSVSAMVSRVVDITYIVELNGHEVGRGNADFKL